MRNAVADVPARLLISVICAVCLSAFLSQPVAGGEGDLAESDWSTAAKRNLAKDPPSAQAVTAFLKRLRINASIALPTEPTDFRFEDLRGSGTLSLVGVVDPLSGCDDGSVIVIDKTGLGFELYAGGGGGTTVADLLRDLDGTGKYELVTHLTLFVRDCASGGPTFPVIYAWTGAGYEDVSNRYPGFYRRELRTLESNTEAVEAELARRAAAKRQPAEPTPQRGPAMIFRLDRGEAPQVTIIRPAQPAPSPAQPAPSPAPLAPPELVAAYENGGKYYWRIEAARIKRFLGISRDAGMGYAISLANSDEWRDRVLAAEIFADIATPEAKGYLHTLSRDSEPPVAGEARYSLRSPRFQPDAQLRMSFVPFKRLGPRAASE